MTKEIFRTMVGSHMWGMQHEGSDTDYFVCYTAPAKTLLDGTAEERGYLKSFVFKENGNDIVYHEAGKVVEQLLKGNVNFLWGVMSPCMVVSNAWHEKLKQIVRKNMAKNCYHSIHGLALHNYKKYIESGKDPSEKRCNTIVRTLGFGISILVRREFEFFPFMGATPDDILRRIGDLEKEHDASKLPEKPNDAEYREWLLSLRLAELSRHNTRMGGS